MLRPSPTTLAALVGSAMVLAALGSGCGGGTDDVADERAGQVRDAALEAGLPEEVADLLATAARGADATYQITYRGDDGASVVVSQQPPNRRVDVLTAGLIVESTVVRDGIAYSCSLPDDGRPGDDLECERTSGTADATGTFTAEAIETFTAQLVAALDVMEVTVDERTIADVRASCLITAPEPGTVLDGTETVDTICLADDGAQLLVDVGGERVVADAYSDDVPDGTFDVDS